MNIYLKHILIGILIMLEVIFLFFISDYCYYSFQEILSENKDLYQHFSIAFFIIVYLLNISFFYEKSLQKNIKILSCLASPYLIVNILGLVSSGNIPRVLDVIFILIGLIIINYKYSNKNTTTSAKHILAVWCSLIFLIYPFVLENVWYMSIKSKTNETQDLGAFNIKIQDRNAKSIMISDLYNKTVCIDMWSSTCGGCIQSMPQFEELSIFYKKNNDIKIISLFCPIKKEQTFEWFSEYINKKFPYHIDYYYIDYEDFRKLNIRSFPEYLIINKNNKLEYKGTLVYEPYMFDNIYSKINSIHEKNY
ncbi:MAG: redoxin family protein [Bacteroidetes bacterium]|nr:redoxin family protein [Bacteroidota bacterium]